MRNETENNATENAWFLCDDSDIKKLNPKEMGCVRGALPGNGKQARYRNQKVAALVYVKGGMLVQENVEAPQRDELVQQDTERKERYAKYVQDLDNDHESVKRKKKLYEDTFAKYDADNTDKQITGEENRMDTIKKCGKGEGMAWYWVDAAWLQAYVPMMDTGRAGQIDNSGIICNKHQSSTGRALVNPHVEGGHHMLKLVSAETWQHLKGTCGLVDLNHELCLQSIQDSVCQKCLMER